MVILTAKTVVSAIRPPYPFGEELVSQFLFVLKLSWFPMTISTFALCLGAPGLQAAGILDLFGTLDRLGGFFVVTAVRFIGPIVTAAVVAGVAGTAITADLGARKIREELDALQVLGVDPIKNLVVPRFLALIVITGLLDVFAIVFGLSAGIAASLLYGQPLGGFFATLFTNALVTDVWGSVLMCTLFGGIIAVVCCYKGMTASGGAAGVGRAVNQAVVISFMGVFCLPLRVHGVLAGHQSRTADDSVSGWLDVPREWLDSFGEVARFGSRVAGLVYSGRAGRFFGESLRQAGILVLGSALIIWAFVFILGLQCGVIGAYFVRSQGAPAFAGLFSAYCDLREGLPYAFGYILSAKVGTGIVAELGAMRISDEIDALEVMGIPPVTFLAATRLLGAWIALPFLYLVGVGIVYFASYLAVVEQIGDVSSGGYLLIFWMFQDPLDVVFSLTKGMAMATVIVIVGCYYGYTASGGPVGVGTATAKSMVVNIILVHIIGMLGTVVFWGSNPRAPIGG